MCQESVGSGFSEICVQKDSEATSFFNRKESQDHQGCLPGLVSFIRAQATFPQPALSECFSLTGLTLNCSLYPITCQKFLSKDFGPIVCNLPPPQGTDSGHSLQSQPICNLAHSLCFNVQPSFVSNLCSSKSQ